MMKELDTNILENQMINENQTEGMSIIVPFLNESEGISNFCNVFDMFVKELPFNIELIFVDDGSTDNTADIIMKYKFINISKAKIIHLSKNFGSHAAIRCGVENAYYDICTWVGSDLQEPLEFINLAYEKLKEGYDAVYVEKKSIKVSKGERLFSKIYSGMMRKYAVSNYSSGGISNIVFNKVIKEYLNRNIESNSSIMLQIMDYGFKNCTLSLEYKDRKLGRSKWTLSKKNQTIYRLLCFIFIYANSFGKYSWCNNVYFRYCYWFCSYYK